MKSHPQLILVSVAVSVAFVSFAGCKTQTGPSAPPPAAKAGVKSTATKEPSAVQRTNDLTGTVVETMNAGGYTYVQVDDGSQRIWAAAPRTRVAVGDRVIVPAGMAMQNFVSKTLNRTFDVVYFVNGIKRLDAPGKDQQVATAHGSLGHSTEKPTVDVSGITKAEGGYTIAELFRHKTTLAGKEVAVRGKVTKFSAAVMGKNWVHLQDGTGTTGGNDLTVTTDGVAAVGNTVLVRGKLITDKDFGYGYKYDVIIEDAKVTVE